MCFYNQPEQELTVEEKLLASMIALDHRIPVGFQIGMPMHLARAIEDVERLFNEHKLPARSELLGELTMWQEHAVQGMRFADQCDRLMRKVIQTVSQAAKRS